VASFCEHGNEHSDFVKIGNILELPLFSEERLCSMKFQNYSDIYFD
jgi:hypothetical protein